MNEKIKNEDLGRKSVDGFKSSAKMPIVIVLDNIRSMHNIGSVFRTSDAFLVEKIYLCGITAQPPHREIQKTALGATESVDWVYFENTIDAIKELKNINYQVYSIEQVANSVKLNEYQYDKNSKIALVFGNEVNGVIQDVVDISDKCIEIPQFGTKHSFNISVTVGIVLWDIYNKIQKTL